MGLSDKDRQMLKALRDGQLETTVLAAILEVSPRMVQIRAKELIDVNLIHRPVRGKYALTVSGRDELELGEAIGSDFGSLTTLLEQLPSEMHRALLRNLIRAVIGRHHLDRDNGLPSALVMGPTGIGKTFTGELITRMLGYESGSLCKDLRARATKGELLGRYGRKRGTEETTFTPSKYLSKPFFILDELDKANPGLQQDALYLIKGSRYALIEGSRVEIKPAVLVTFNQKIEEPEKVSAILDDAVLRRCFPMNFYIVALDIAETRKRLRKIAQGQVPRLDLDALRPIKEQLTDVQYDLVEELMSANLNEDGERLMDVQPTALLILADTAFSNSVEESIYAVMYDLLLGAHTFGWVEPGWRERLLEAWANYRGLSLDSEDRPPLPEEDVELVDRRQQRMEEASGKLVEKDVAVGEFIGKRSHVAEGFGELHDKLSKLTSRSEKRMTKGQRDKLKHYEKVVNKIAIGDEVALEKWRGILKKEEDVTLRFLEQYEAYQAKAVRQKAEINGQEEKIQVLKKDRKEYDYFYKRKRNNKDDDVLAQLIRLESVRDETRTVESTVEPDWIDKVFHAGKNLVRPRIFWKTYPIETLGAWAAPPLTERMKQDLRFMNQPVPADATDQQRAFAQMVLRNVATNDQYFQRQGDVINVAFDNPPETPPQPKKIEWEKKILVGCDGKEYQAGQLRRWDSPQVKTLLKHKMDGFDVQIASETDRLEQLTTSHEESVAMLESDVGRIIDIRWSELV